MQTVVMHYPNLVLEWVSMYRILDTNIGTGSFLYILRPLYGQDDFPAGCDALSQFGFWDKGHWGVVI
jgi:hypothetical protein